jgi:uncharacterized protein YprB with RNaseH-like and TPR domain
MPSVLNQTFLDLAEKSGALVSLDTESTGLNGDYNSLLVISAKPFGKKPVTFKVDKPGDDKQLLIDGVAFLRQFLVPVAYFGFYHDMPLIETRLLIHGLPPWQPPYEIDPWMIAKRRLKTSRRSQGHLLSWLRPPEQKMGLSADDWNQFIANWEETHPLLVARCESDVKGLEALYRKLRPQIRNFPRRVLA